MSTSPELPPDGEGLYAPKRRREQERTTPRAVGEFSPRENDDLLDDAPVGLRRTRLVARLPLVGRPPRPQPDAPDDAITARDVALATIVSLVSTVAVIAFYRFATTPPAPTPQLAAVTATRVVEAAAPAAPADAPARRAAVQSAVTGLAAVPPIPAAPPARPLAATSGVAPADVRSSAAEPQASGLRPATPPEQRQAMASLVARGKELLRSGDFSSARLVLERAADAGEPDAALTLGSSYDPAILARLGIRRQVANVDLARTWYEKAEEFGSTEASASLKALPDR